MDLSLLQYRAMQIPGAQKVGNKLEETTRILRDIEFNCTTEITGVIFGAVLRINRDLFPNIHIWRPAGNNTYRMVPESVRVIYYSTNNVTTSGVFEYSFASPISVANGDLLGISQPSLSDSRLRVYYINGMNGFVSYSVISSSTSENLASLTPITNELVLVYPVTGMHVHECEMSNYNFPFYILQQMGIVSRAQQMLIQSERMHWEYTQ